MGAEEKMTKKKYLEIRDLDTLKVRKVWLPEWGSIIMRDAKTGELLDFTITDLRDKTETKHEL